MQYLSCVCKWLRINKAKEIYINRQIDRSRHRAKNEILIHCHNIQLQQQTLLESAGTLFFRFWMISNAHYSQIYQAVQSGYFLEIAEWWLFICNHWKVTLFHIDFGGECLHSFQWHSKKCILKQPNYSGPGMASSANIVACQWVLQWIRFINDIAIALEKISRSIQPKTYWRHRYCAKNDK